MRKLLVTLLWIGICSSLRAQSITLSFNDSIHYNKDLKSYLFSRTDSIKDSIWINGGLNQYFNQPVRANCITSGDIPPGGTDSLIFCDCMKKHDTILVQLSSPSACCYSMMSIAICKRKFQANVEFSFDVAPQMVLLNPSMEELVIRQEVLKKGDLLEGYIVFTGKGHYEKQYWKELSKAEKERVFKGNVKGYFKCRLK